MPPVEFKRNDLAGFVAPDVVFVAVKKSKYPTPPRVSLPDTIIAAPVVEDGVYVKLSAPEVPDVEPVIVSLTESDNNVPTDVREELTTLDANIVPVSVPASAVTVPELPKLMAVPLTVTELLVNAPFGIPLKFVPVSVGVVVQDGVAPDVAACRTPAAFEIKAE